MAEEVVEQVGLDQVVELGAGADPHRHREAAVREMVVEDGVGDQSRHADDAPAGQRLEPRVDGLEVGNGVADAEGLQALQELVAGMALGERGLALDEQPPHGLVFVRIGMGMLRHRPVRRHAAVVATQVLERGKVHTLNMGTRGGVNPGEVGPVVGPDFRDILYRIRYKITKTPMIELDDIDRRIVATLQAEGRLPIVDLADRVGLSATPCQRRVKRLEEEGVITRYAALVSPPALGLGLQALVQVTLDDHSEKTVEAFEAAIRARPEVVACYAVTGDMDFLLHVLTPDLAEFQRLRAEGAAAHARRPRHALVLHHAGGEERSRLGADPSSSGGVASRAAARGWSRTRAIRAAVRKSGGAGGGTAKVFFRSRSSMMAMPFW